MAKRAAAVLSALVLATSLVPAQALAAPSEEPGYEEAQANLVSRIQSSVSEAQQNTFTDEYGFTHAIGDEGDSSVTARSKAALPETYTAPYTEVKSQGMLNTCWAFAAIASLESSYLKQLGSTETNSDAIDLSEAQAVYGSYNGATEDGTPDGTEKTTSDNDHPVTTDGAYGFNTYSNWIAPASSLAAGRGAAYESDVPLEVPWTETERTEYAADMAADAAANYSLSRVRVDSVEKAPEINSYNTDGTRIWRDWNQNNIESVKQLLFEKGALSVLYYAEGDVTSPYYHTAVDPDDVSGASSDVADGTASADENDAEGLGAAEQNGQDSSADEGLSVGDSAVSAPDEAGAAADADGECSNSGESATLEEESSEDAASAEGAAAVGGAVTPGATESADGGADASRTITYQVPKNFWVHDPDTAGPNGTALGVNHLVAIVGWDDTYSRWNFATPLYDDEGNARTYDTTIAKVEKAADGTEYIVPVRDGAWLIKNSWGAKQTSSDGSVETIMGDNGMFYFSYCEKTMINPTSYSVDAETGGTPYDIVQQYDGAPAVSLTFVQGEPSQGANVFTAEQDQLLDAVGTWVQEPGSTASVRVYTDLSDLADPESGTLVLEQQADFANRGWYTIDLNEQVELSEGEAYSVVVSFAQQPSASGVTANLPIEAENNAELGLCRVYADEGESFIQSLDADGTVHWVDLGTLAGDGGVGCDVGNLCVKAFSEAVPEPEPEPEPDPDPGSDPDPDPEPTVDPTDNSGGSDASLKGLATTGDSLAVPGIVIVAAVLSSGVAAYAGLRAGSGRKQARSKR